MQIGLKAYISPIINIDIDIYIRILSGADIMEHNTADTMQAVDAHAVLARISTAMKAKGIKGADVTKALGISHSSFSSWKNGKSTSYMKHIEGLAKLLDTPAAFLLHGEDLAQTPSAAQMFHSLEEHGFNLKDVAKTLGVSPSSIYNWRAKGAIPARHIDGMLAITNSADRGAVKAPKDAARDGLLDSLKQKHISKVNLAKHLGISKATVYGWKDDQSIPEKYIDDIKAVLQGEPEALTFENAERNAAVSAFADEMASCLKAEMQGLSADECKACLDELNMQMRLSARRIKQDARIRSALGI